MLSDRTTALVIEMGEHPKLIGDRTTLAVMLALIDAGLDVSVPFGENCRYDLIIDHGRRLTRVQCKTGRLRDGAVRFATASTYGHLPSPCETRRDYLGEIDEFAVYCPGTGGMYLLPIQDVTTRANAYLRVDPPRNGQRKRIRYARDYEIARVECHMPANRSRTEVSPARAASPSPGRVREARRG
jgi:hypothetical protein